MSLPGRATSEEDAWIRGLHGQDEHAIVDAVRAAVQAGRPALAARAVGLLHEDQDDPDLVRAQNAARLLCLRPEPVLWVELDDALEQLRARRLARFKERHRAAVTAPTSLFDPLTPERRKRRR